MQKFEVIIVQGSELRRVKSEMTHKYKTGAKCSYGIGC